MGDNAELKSARLLSIYMRLQSGQVLNKTDLVTEYGVTERSIQRDIEFLRCFLVEHVLPQDITFDRKAKGYRMVRAESKNLTNSEILAVCKILLESRSMRKDEMLPILDKLIDCAVPEDGRKAVKTLIANEQLHYIPPHHGQPVLTGLWEIGQAVKNHHIMEITYERMMEPGLVERRILPVGIMFSEYYFYLTAFTDEKDQTKTLDNPSPRIYRIDRIKKFQVLSEHFRLPYRNRFEEGEFRKRVQFMFGGELQTIRFRYTGPSLEAVLDRLPTAQVIRKDENGWLISAEVFGTGIDMWLRSQGDYITEISRN